MIRAAHLLQLADMSTVFLLSPARCGGALALAAAHVDATVVLLGSIATDKYVDTLVGVFGKRLVFPSAFVGRGDMSRGGLLLLATRSGAELDYVPVDGAVRHGVRPPKLERLARAQPELPPRRRSPTAARLP